MFLFDGRPRIGFTGTQRGMSAKQEKLLRKNLKEFKRRVSDSTRMDPRGVYVEFPEIAKFEDSK